MSPVPKLKILKIANIKKSMKQDCKLEYGKYVDRTTPIHPEH